MLPGVYNIDPSGQRSREDSVETFCKDGWTWLLRRGSEVNVSWFSVGNGSWFSAGNGS
jgi:hypothetical protein